MTKTMVKTDVIAGRRLNQYAGEWVALVGGKVVEHSETLKELMRKVESRKLKKEASVFLVPRKDEGPYVLVIMV